LPEPWLPRYWEVGINYETTFAESGIYEGRPVVEGEPVVLTGAFRIFAAEEDHADVCAHVHMRHLLRLAGVPFS
jgi:hypothetical protein